MIIDHITSDARFSGPQLIFSRISGQTAGGGSVSGKIARDTIPTQEPGGLFTGMVLDGIGTTSTNSPGHNYTFRATLSLTPTLLIEEGEGGILVPSPPEGRGQGEGEARTRTERS